MWKRIVFLIVLVGGVIAAAYGCYQDDSAGLNRGKVARVLLTDAPFPYDSIQSVNVHIVRVEANDQPDTTSGGQWVLITAPNKAFDLIQLQQGTTALLGEGELSGHLYRSIRVVIDCDRSSIIRTDGARATVHWPVSGQMTIYTTVEEPLALLADQSNVEIVLDFDIGRSFLYNYFGAREFTVIPWIRAVHKAYTGTIAGTVTSSYTGAVAPIKNANITVYSGDLRAVAYVVATGRTDAAGNYKVAFVGSGTYVVRIEQPDLPQLDPVTIANVEVVSGATTPVSASLPPAGSSGGAYLRISGPTSVGVGGSITLLASVGDPTGDPLPFPSVTWTSSDVAIAAVTGVGDTAAVVGRAPGSATITASSGGLSDQVTIQVVGSAAAVASVTVVPGSATLAVGGDSAGFHAELRDGSGNLLSGRPVTWFTPDSSVIRLYGYGLSALVLPRAVGTATVRATSEGKTGTALVTVH